MTNKGAKQLTDEQAARATELREQGLSFADIAKELGVTKAAAYRAAKDAIGTGASKTEELPEFLDAEGRFDQLLKSYSVKDTCRIVSYCSTQGENIYGDLDGLRRCLIDQGIASGRVGPIIKHWAAIQQLPLPERLATELGAEVPATRLGRGAKWSVIDGRPEKDPDGDLTFNEAYKIAQLERQPQSGDSKILEFVIARQDKSDSRIEALLEKLSDQRFGMLQEAVISLGKRFEDRESQHQVTDKIALLGKGMDHVVNGVDKARSDLRPLLESMVARGQGPPRPRTLQEKVGFSQGLSKGIEKERQLREMEDRLFLGGGRKEPPGIKPPAKVFE